MTSDDTLRARERDARLNAYLRVTAPQGRLSVRTGPFLATFDPDRDNPYRNYAIPDDGAEPTPGEIAAFEAVCRDHGRRPRLEYAPAAAPKLEAVLLAAGFEVELRPPVLTCGPQTVRTIEPPAGFELRLVRTREDRVLTGRVQNDAYAEHGLGGDADPDQLAGMIEAGGVCMLVVERASGAPAAAGLYTPPAAGLTEVAGIGVATAFRRRGLATALTSALTRHAFANGLTFAFLTPGGDVAQRAYERAGFEVGGEMLMIGRPADP